VAGLFFVARHALREITQKKVTTEDEHFQKIEADGLFTREAFERLPKIELELTSQDGLKLRGHFIEDGASSRKVVLLVHGYTAGFPWMLQFVNMYRRMGFSVLVFDQRRHGRSEGLYSTYGYKEKYDVAAWVQWVRDRKGDDCVIGLHGQSLGGGTVLEYSGLDNDIAFIVADCPYSDLTELMVHQFRNLNRIPTFPLFAFTDWLMRLQAGFSFRDVSPIRTIRDNPVPVMFIHGTDDVFVPTWMSEAMYKAKQGVKRLLLIKGAVHANAYGVSTEEYEREVEAFVTEALARAPREGAERQVQAGLQPSILR